MAGPGLESRRADPPPSTDGKLYDAYVSYSDSPEDRKFVNFILKPQLERRRGYKLFLDDRDLLPRAGTAAPRPFPLGPRPVSPRFRPRLRPAPPPSQAGPRPRRRPRSRRAVRRPPGEPEPLPAPRRGAVGRLPGPGLVQPQLPVGSVRGWVEPSRAPADGATLAGRACAGCWSSRADPSSSPSRASDAIPLIPRSACCVSTATW